MFIDETSVNNCSFSRCYGRAYRGRRARGRFPKAKKNRVTAICAMGWDGVIAYHVIEGSASAKDFSFFIMYCLAPALDGKPSIIILDNAKIHHAVPEVEAAMKLLGHQWRFLPAYSPDLNPIENMFSKLKTVLTYWCFALLSHPMLCVSEALVEITAQNARGWFRLCNYC